MSNFIFLFLLLVCISGCSTHTHGDPNAEAVIHKVVEDNFYTTDRGLEQYIQYFGLEFEADINNLTESMHWIDGGAGNAYAQKDYLKTRGNRPIPFLTPITVKYPEKEPLTLQDGKFKVFADRYFEDIPLSELRPADIITDVVGIINYTRALDVSLDKYLKLLKPGGKIYLFIPDFITTIKTKSGEELLLREWIDTIPGLQTNTLSAPKSPYRPGFSYVIEKLNPNVVVPKLRLQEATHNNMVFRKFEEI
jgi:SAM-dependent methyltransferase